MEPSLKCKSAREWAGEISQIYSWLFISGARAIKPESLKALGITSIINVTKELPNLTIDTTEILNIPISDSQSTAITPFIPIVADKIENVKRSGGKILIHCVAGVSRSPTLVLAYMIIYQGVSLRKAFLHLKQIRPIIHPNSNFFSQLIQLELEVRGETSVELISAKNGRIADVFSLEEIQLMNCSSWTDIIMQRKTLKDHFT